MQHICTYTQRHLPQNRASRAQYLRQVGRNEHRPRALGCYVWSMRELTLPGAKLRCLCAVTVLLVAAACNEFTAEDKTSRINADANTNTADTGGAFSDGGAACPRNALHAFVLRDTYGINQTPNDSVSRFDTQCRQEAKDAGLSDRWVAWLWTNNRNPTDVIDLAAAYCLTDNTTRVVRTGADLTVSLGSNTFAPGVLLNPISLTANGTRPLANPNDPNSMLNSGPVWTGMPDEQPNGPSSCNEWRGGGLGHQGDFGAKSKAWANTGIAGNCDEDRARIYCVEAK
jgi:hypothetical protein